MLSGRFPSSDFADLRPRLRWDRATDTLSARGGTELVARMNAGTIPDRGLYHVHVAPDGPRVGELDEEMVFESRPGQTITLGASTWPITEITRDRVLVAPAPGETGRLPFWRGEGPGRPIELGRALGAFTREIDALSRSEAEATLRGEYRMDAFAARNLLDHLAEQRAATGAVPSDRAITIAFVRDAAMIPASATAVVWGRAGEDRLRRSALADGRGMSIVRLEDGFLRSVGLGTDLVRPLSWIADSRGIYYDATGPSDLEHILQTKMYNDAEKERARALRDRIVALGIT